MLNLKKKSGSYFSKRNVFYYFKKLCASHSYKILFDYNFIILH